MSEVKLNMAYTTIRKMESELSALREELSRKDVVIEDMLESNSDMTTCLAAAEQRNANVERALSGLLFEFDDGVNGGRDEPVAALDYARTLIDAAEFKPTESGASE